jgi:Domain of unknown function (DUF4407)
MCAQKTREHRIEAVLAWLGGGHRPELSERHERSSHAIAGVVVAVDALLAWLVAALALAGSTHWPTPAVIAVTLVFGVLVGAVTRAIAAGPKPGRAGIVARGAVALAIGVVVGQLAALDISSGSIDRRVDEQAARNADSAPAVVQAAADLDRTRAGRAGLDDAVDQARGHRDDALVVARCEYNPSPACPQTDITGVPGTGPETQTANDRLAGAQRELDDALAARAQKAPALDAQIAGDERALARARETAIVGADRGLGARWLAMRDGGFALQLAMIGFFALLSLLPLILRLWRGETTHDRSAAARAERERAELEADTAIAVKRAQVRAAAETLWADQQLAKARLAVEAQTEIDRAEHRRRVAEALQTPRHAASQRAPQPADEDIYLPIAEDAEAASRAAALPASGREAGEDEPENLPARVEPADHDRGDGGAPLVPSIPDVAKAAARWIRPLVPPFVARAIDTTTQPLRTARQVFEEVFEEVEEITFTLKRTHKVSVHAEQGAAGPQQPRSVGTDTRVDARRVDASIAGDLDAGGPPSREVPAGQRRPELTEQDGPRELPHGRRQLPPAE